MEQNVIRIFILSMLASSAFSFVPNLFYCDQLNEDTLNKLKNYNFVGVIINPENTLPHSNAANINFLEYTHGMGKCLKKIETLRIDGCKADNAIWINLITELSQIESLEILNADLYVFNFDWISSPKLINLSLNGNKELSLKGNSTAKLETFSCLDCKLKESDIQVLSQFQSLISIENTDVLASDILRVFPALKLLNNIPAQTIKDHQKTHEEVKNSSSGPFPEVLAFLAVSMVILGKNYSRTGILLFVLIAFFHYASAQKLSRLSMRNADIPVLGNDSFMNVSKNYSNISITYSGIFYVNLNAFIEFDQLISLSLANNNLKTFYIELNQLETLDLSNNQIEYIETKLFENSPNLQYLILDDNRLTNINWDLTFHASFVKVLLNRNHLENIRIISSTLEELWIKYGNSKVQFSPDCEMNQLTYLAAEGTSIQNPLSDVCEISESELIINVIDSNTGMANDFKCPTKKLFAFKQLETSTTSITPDFEDVIEPKEQVKLSDCTYSTLRVKVDDIVMSKMEYDFLIMAFYGLFCISCMLMTGICFLAIQFTRLSNPKSHKQFDNEQGRKLIT